MKKYSITILQKHYNANGGRNGFNYYKVVETQPLDANWREVEAKAHRGDRTYVIHEEGTNPLEETNVIDFNIPLPLGNDDESIIKYVALKHATIDNLIKPV